MFVINETEQVLLLVKRNTDESNGSHSSYGTRCDSLVPVGMISGSTKLSFTHVQNS